MKKLKPCPLCGAEAFMWRTNYEVFVQCSKFNAATPGNEHIVRISRLTEEYAVKVWNTRTEGEK